MNSTLISREVAIKFLGVFLDENLTWKNHIQMIENKVAKSISILYRAKFHLNKYCLKQIYFSFIHSYINYANIAWASTHKSKLMRLYRQQKQASRIIFGKDKYTHAKPLLKKINVLNIFQLNIYQNLIFMYKLNRDLTPITFKSKFNKRTFHYNLRASSSLLYDTSLKKTKLGHFSITYRSPFLWNNVISDKERDTLCLSQFKQTIKIKLLNGENELDYF